MSNKKDQNLFYRRKSRARIATVSVLAGLTALGGTAVALDITPKALADSEFAAGSVDSVDIEALSALTKGSGGQSIAKLIKPVSASLKVDGKSTEFHFVGPATVEDLLEKSGVKLNDEDLISQPMDAPLKEGKTITITRVTTEEMEEEVQTDFEIVYEEDDSLAEGEEVILQEGENKITKDVYSVTLHDGKEFKKELLSSEVVQEGQDQIIAVGTAVQEEDDSEEVSDNASIEETSYSEPADTLNQSSAAPAVQSEPEKTSEPEVTAAEPAASQPEEDSSQSTGGSTGEFTYSKAITCTAFAYTAPAGARGASGNPAVPGTCAVDPSVIPMGSRLYIEGYGYATANDTGGAIIGNTVDVFYSTYDECANWGRRTVTVYILD